MQLVGIIMLMSVRPSIAGGNFKSIVIDGEDEVNCQLETVIKLLLEENMVTLVVHPELCSGCRACELICSFHHKGTFSRGNSSVYVRRNERKGIFEITVEGPPTCDLCKDEKYPMCVQFCSREALTLRRVKS